MIERYLLPEIAEVWTYENKLRKWVLVEITTAKVQAERGILPREAIRSLEAKLENLDYSKLATRQKEIEKEVEHDVIAFLIALEELFEEAKYLHYGMTSSDLVDTANALLMKEAMQILLEAYREFADVLKEKALEYKYLPIMGRTHGMYAEPTTLGLKFLGYYAEAMRNLERLKYAYEQVIYGKISGAVGNYAFMDPSIEEEVMRRLGLKYEPISTQIVPRDRYAHLINSIVLASECMERLSLEIRLLSRTEVGELEEPFGRAQRGSSAMPHKRNPIRSERINGLVRYIRGFLIPANENVALWHERDISHSSVERIMLPDITSAFYYITKLSTRILRNIVVNVDRIKWNIERFGRFYLSQPLLLKLVSKGVSRKQAYAWIKELAHTSPENFEDAVRKDERINAYLTREEIEDALNHNYFKHVDYIFQRVLGSFR